MAKKKRRIVEQPEEEYEFIPTEFNEREFILKDVYMTKVFTLVMALALIIGVLSAFIYNYSPSNWYIGMAISFIVAMMMGRILKLFKFRVDMLDIKSMMANYILFLVLALGICILFINDPFHITF